MQTIKNRTIAILGTVVLGVSSLGFATAASASTSDVPQTRVLYADLDLSSAQGQKILANRVGSATNRVCASFETGDKLDALTCRDEAKARAYADLRARGVALR